MNRRNFIKRISIGAALAPLAPSVVNEFCKTKQITEGDILNTMLESFTSMPPVKNGSTYEYTIFTGLEGCRDFQKAMKDCHDSI